MSRSRKLNINLSNHEQSQQDCEDIFSRSTTIGATSQVTSMNEAIARRWVAGPGVVCYLDPPAAIVETDGSWQDRRERALLGGETQRHVVPARGGIAWEALRGDVVRISIPEGSQVGDLNAWNLHNYEEHFFSGKTRQLHATHLTTGDRLWSTKVRPMATVVADSLHGYGLDPDGAGVHDVIGTRCDPYTKRLLGMTPEKPTCHSNLVEAVASRGLSERHVHDVWNVFMCTGFNKDGRYFVKPSPARTGDYVEILADMDLLLALSACPQGDVSQPVGKPVPPESCHPLLVQVFSATST